MTSSLLAILGLALLAGAWGVVQQLVAHRDPEQPGVEGSCHGCRGGCPRGVCRKEFQERSV